MKNNVFEIQEKVIWKRELKKLKKFTFFSSVQIDFTNGRIRSITGAGNPARKAELSPEKC